MRFLADENFPRAAVIALSQAGHDVVSVATAGPGMTDAQVLSLATRERRVILTFDKDFGELARSADIPAACGIVLFRLAIPPAQVGSRLADLVAGRSDWPGHFSVVEADRVRMRPLSQR